MKSIISFSVISGSYFASLQLSISISEVEVVIIGLLCYSNETANANNVLKLRHFVKVSLVTVQHSINISFVFFTSLVLGPGNTAV